MKDTAEKDKPRNRAWIGGLVGLTVIAVVIFSVYGILSLKKKEDFQGRGKAILLLVPLSLLLIVGNGIFLYVGRRLTKKASSNARNLYINGIGTIATVMRIKLKSNYKRKRNRRWAWIVQWQYIVDGQAYLGISPLDSVPTINIGDTSWILYNPDNVWYAMRWTLFDHLNSVENRVSEEGEKVVYHLRRNFFGVYPD